VHALPADAFADGFGVNTHLNWWDSVQGTSTSVYEEEDRIVSALVDLRCRHVRDAFPLDVERGAVLRRVHEAAAVRFSLVTFWNAGAAEYVEAGLVYGSAIEAIEGCNEPDLFPDQCTPDLVRGWQRTLADEVRPHLGVELLGTPMCHPVNASTFGDMSDWMDVGNLHVYGRRTPYTAEGLREHWNHYRVSCGDRPLRVTETGYTSNGIHLNVSDRAAGAYLSTALLTNVANGVDRTYIYELVDEGGHVPAEEYGQNAFGLLTERFEPKPAYLQLRDLMRLLDDPGPAFTPRPLDLRVSGAAASTLFQRRDGAHLLVLWREDPVYDPTTGEDLSPAPSPVRVEVRGGADAVVHVVGGGAPSMALGRVTGLDVDVAADAPTVIVLAANGIGK
jgi:hypothetical protein